MILCLPIPDAEDDWGEAESTGPATEKSIYDTEGQALSPYFTMAKKHGEKLAENSYPKKRSSNLSEQGPLRQNNIAHSTYNSLFPLSS